VNPKTGRKVLTNSKIGRVVLNNYLKASNGANIVGGASPIYQGPGYDYVNYLTTTSFTPFSVIDTFHTDLFHFLTNTPHYLAHFGILSATPIINVNDKDGMEAARLFLEQIEVYFDYPAYFSDFTKGMVPGTYRNSLSLPDYVGISEDSSCTLTSGREATARECYIRTILVQSAKLRLFHLMHNNGVDIRPAMEHILSECAALQKIINLLYITFSGQECVNIHGGQACLDEYIEIIKDIFNSYWSQETIGEILDQTINNLGEKDITLSKDQINDILTTKVEWGIGNIPTDIGQGLLF